MKMIGLNILLAVIVIITAGCEGAPSDTVLEASLEISNPNPDINDDTLQNEEDTAVEMGGIPYATGVKKDGYQEYLFTRMVHETENWIDFTALSETDTIKYTISLPLEYVFMGTTVFSVAEQKVSELSFVVKLKEGQKMPTTLEGFGGKLGPNNHDDWCTNYYDGELLSTDEGEVFLTRQVVEPYGGEGYITIWYPHTFYFERDGYIITTIFYPLEEYPEEDAMAGYLKIVTSINVIK